MFGMNFEMVKGLLERYGASGAILLVTLGFLPGDWASAVCTTDSGATISTTQIIIIGGVLLAQTVFGVKLNTSSALTHASKVAAEATTTTTPETIKVAEATVKELKKTMAE